MFCAGELLQCAAAAAAVCCRKSGKSHTNKTKKKYIKEKPLYSGHDMPVALHYIAITMHITLATSSGCRASSNNKIPAEPHSSISCKYGPVHFYLHSFIHSVLFSAVIRSYTFVVVVAVASFIDACVVANVKLCFYTKKTSNSSSSTKRPRARGACTKYCSRSAIAFPWEHSHNCWRCDIVVDTATSRALVLLLLLHFFYLVTVWCFPFNRMLLMMIHLVV